MIFVIAVIFVTVVAPIWLILHYTTKWRNSKGLNREELQSMEDIWQLANKMEARIKNLETILDADKAAGGHRE